VIKIVLILLLAFAVQKAGVWSEEGHRTVAEVAKRALATDRRGWSVDVFNGSVR